MSALFEWLGLTIAKWLGDNGLWGAIKGVVTSVWTITVFWVTLALLGLKLVGDLTIRAMQQLASILDHGVGHVTGVDPCGGQISNILALANTFYPLDETLQLVAGLMIGVWVPLGIYRLIKSYIPGIATG